MKWFIFVSVFLFGCSFSGQNDNSAVLLDNYEATVLELMEENNRGGDPANIQKYAQSLMGQGSHIIKQFKDENQQCHSYLKELLDAKDKMLELNLDEIETQYHAGEALPATEQECFDIKELIVHPATVIILTMEAPFTEKHRNQITDEMVEVLAHKEVLQQP